MAFIGKKREDQQEKQGYNCYKDTEWMFNDTQHEITPAIGCQSMACE